MGIRSLPSRLLGRGPRRSDVGRPVLEVARASGFVCLAEDVPRELVMGAAGRFWTLAPGQCVPLAGPQAFLEFAAPDHVRTTMDFRVLETGPGTCRVTTETRIGAADAPARREVGRARRIIAHGSALTRSLWRGATKKRAESLA